MSFSKIVVGAFLALCAVHALARGPFVPHGGPAGFAGAYPHYPYAGYPIVSYPSRSSAPLVGSWEREGSSISVIGPREPDVEWTPMFSQDSRPKVQGVPVSSMRGSAKGSYIYIAPGRKGGKEFSTMIEGLPPEGTIEWSKK